MLSTERRSTERRLPVVAGSGKGTPDSSLPCIALVERDPCLCDEDVDLGSVYAKACIGSAYRTPFSIAISSSEDGGDSGIFIGRSDWRGLVTRDKIAPVDSVEP